MTAGVLDRYVWRELAGPFLGSTALLTFVLISERIAALTDLVVVQGVPLSLVLGLAAFTIPSLLVHTVPMGFLIAVLLAMARLGEDLELVALGASGLGPGRLARPVLAAATALAVGTAALTFWLAPRASAAFATRLDTLVRQHAAAGIRPGAFNEPVSGFLIHVLEAHPAEATFEGVLVADEREAGHSRIITAREARFLPRADAAGLTLRLSDGTVHESEPGRPAHYRAIGFARYDMALRLPGARGTASGVPHPEEMLTVGRLRAAIVERQRRGQEATRLVVDLHKRVVFPLEVPLFAVIGFALGLAPRRWRRAGALGLGLALGVGFYVVLSGLVGVALVGRMPAWLAVWTAPAVVAALGALAWRSTSRPPRSVRPSPGPPAWRPRAWSPPGRLRRHLWPRSAGPVGVLDGYLLSRYALGLGGALAVGGALSTAVDVLQTLDDFLSQRPPLSVLAEYEILRLPYALHQQLPIAVAVATALLFVSLVRHHELTALHAAGVSLYRVSRPVLGLALVTSLGALAFQETMLPGLHERAEALYRTEIRGEPPPGLEARTRIWYRSTDGRFLRARRLDPVGRRLDGATLLELDAGGRVTRRLEAQEARWTPAGWELVDGVARDIAPSGAISTAAFTTLPSGLLDPVEDITRPWRPMEFMSSRELRADVERLRGSGTPVRDLLVELYGRQSFALVTLIAALVAIPLGLIAPGAGRLTGVAAVLLLTMAYWPLHSMALALARVGLLSPLVGAWSGDVVFAGLGLSLFLRART